MAAQFVLRLGFQTVSELKDGHELQETLINMARRCPFWDLIVTV